MLNNEGGQLEPCTTLFLGIPGLSFFLSFFTMKASRGLPQDVGHSSKPANLVFHLHTIKDGN